MNIKKEILNGLQNLNFDIVNECYIENAASTSRVLQMYVYGLPDDLIRWRAIEFIGRLAELHAKENDELFRNIIRRFIWQMCEESANVPWASAEVIGSLISHVKGAQFKEFIGPWFYHVDLNDICYSGLYWALPQMMTHHKTEVLEFLPKTFSWFDNFDIPELYAYAGIYFNAFPNEEAQPYLEKWKNDQRMVKIYSHGNIIENTVSFFVLNSLS